MPGRSDLAQCLKCGLNFLNEEGLGKHTKRVHEGKEQIQPSKYKCDRCSDEFLIKDDFKKHKVPREFSCELCQQKGEVIVLPTKCEYNFHIITHRTGKPKICDNCGSEFKNNKNLKTHKEQDKTVSCRRCNKIFIGSCPLQKHIKNEHDTKNEPIPPLQRQYSGRQNINRSQTTKVVIPQLANQQSTTVVSKPSSQVQNYGIKTEPSESHTAQQQPSAKKAKVIEKASKTTVKANTIVKNENQEVLEPLDQPALVPVMEQPTLLVPVVAQEFFIPPEFMPGLCANEEILGI